MNTNVSDYVEPAKSQVSDTLQDAQQRLTETAKKAGYVTDRYVRDNPWITIGLVAVMAGAFGYLIASMQD